MSEENSKAIVTGERPKKKKSKKKERVVLSPVEWLALLETSVESNSKTSPVNHIFQLITENRELVLSEEEVALRNQHLQRLPLEDKSRLNVSLTLHQRTQQNQQQAKVIGSLIEILRPQSCQVNEEMLKDNYAERLYEWLEVQYREQYPKSGLTELFVFSRNIMAQLLAPNYMPYADAASMQLIQFVTKYYNPAKEGKFPFQNGKKTISDPSEVIVPLYKMMRDALDVKSDPDLANYITALYRIFEVRVHNALREKANWIMKYDQLVNSHEELQTRYHHSQRELFDHKKQSSELKKTVSQNNENLEQLKTELENERLRYEQQVRMLEARLITEKTGTVAQIKGKIEFQLSEMEEALLSTNDEKTKKFIQYNMANIRKFLNKTE